MSDVQKDGLTGHSRSQSTFALMRNCGGLCSRVSDVLRPEGRLKESIGGLVGLENGCVLAFVIYPVIVIRTKVKHAACVRFDFLLDVRGHEAGAEFAGSTR
jgi:hypothetical protein